MNLPQTSNTMQVFQAKYGMMEGYMERAQQLLDRLQMNIRVSAAHSLASQDTEATLAAFDGWLEPLVRAELQKALADVRAKAVEKERAAGAGSASVAVKRRTYKDRLGGNVNILDEKRRLMPAGHRAEPTGGESGIRRKRNVSERTERLRGYQGADRAFILRFQEDGTQQRFAKGQASKGRRSGATWGNRGSLRGSRAFNSVAPAMEQAAQTMGQNIEQKVGEWIDNNLAGQ